MLSRVGLIGNIIAQVFCVLVLLICLHQSVSLGSNAVSSAPFYVNVHNPYYGAAAGVWGILVMLVTWRVQNGKGGSWK